MRCAEAQQLISKGHSRLYFNTPNPHSMSPFADEVDRHATTCYECGELLIVLLRAQLRRKPGPCHWHQVRQCSTRIREQNRTAAVQSFVEEAPLVRIANTLLQQAIKEGATTIRLMLESSRRPFRPYVERKPAKQVQPKTQPNNLMETMRQDIASMISKDETGLRVCVSYCVGEKWFDVMTMPAYIAPPLWARFKSMAELLVSVEDEPQLGRIQIRYENRGFNVFVSTHPDEPGEMLLLELALAVNADSAAAA